jgi:hypothetical protein
VLDETTATMTAFPSIKSFKVMGAEVELNRSLVAVENNPNNVAARNRLATQVAKLSKQPNLTPETRLALSKTQVTFGQHKEVATNLQPALKEKPKLQVDPQLRAEAGGVPPQTMRIVTRVTQTSALCCCATDAMTGQSS